MARERGRAGRAGGSAHDERQATQQERPGRLEQWQVDRGARPGIERGLLDVAHDADDGKPGLILRTAEADLEPLAEWILSWPDRTRQSIGDDRDAGRSVGIVLAEGAAAQQRNAHRRKVIGADGRLRHDELRRALLCVFDDEIAHQQIAADRQPVDGASVDDAGSAPEALRDVRRERAHLGRCRVRSFGQRHGDGQDVLCLEAGIDVRQAQEALHHQSRAGNQHERQRHFGNYQHIQESRAARLRDP